MAAVLVAAVLVTTAPDAALADPPSTPATPCTPAADTAETATRLAASCGGRVEVLGARNEISQTFANANGTMTLEQSIEPVRVRRESTWVPVDPTLKRTGDTIAPRAAVHGVTFSAGGDAALATVTSGAHRLTMDWPGKLPEPKLAGDSALYPEVLPGVDLKVTATALGFSEVLVVKTLEAAKNPALDEVTFDLSTQGLTVTETPAGGLTAADAHGNEVFSSPAPVMWDSSVTAEDSSAPAGAKPGAEASAVPDGARRAVMPVDVRRGKLTVRPDQKLLEDPGAKLPIMIDPAWSGGISGNAWTSVFSNHPSNSFWKNSTALTNAGTYGAAGAGRTRECDYCSDFIVRSFFTMDSTGFRKAQVIKATFAIEQKWAWTCDPYSNAKLWFTGAVSAATTWNNQPAWHGDSTAQAGANRKVGASHRCAGPGPVEFDVTGLASRAASGNWSTITFGLRAMNEGVNSQWKRFTHSSPKLSVTYNRAPDVPSNRWTGTSACVSGQRPYVTSLTPTLTATQTDPDGDAGLTTSLYWWPLGGSRNETDKVSQSAGNKVAVAKPIPAGKLQDNGTYVWQAVTKDAYSTSAFSPTCEFTVDVTAPGAPGSMSSPEYPRDTRAGGVGVPGQFTVDYSAADKDQIVGYAWSTSSTVQPSGANQIGVDSAKKGSFTYTPTTDGVVELRVWAKDRAGWYSPTPVVYSFSVKSGAGPVADWHFDPNPDDTAAGPLASDFTLHGNTLTVGSGVTATTGRGGAGTAAQLAGTGFLRTAGPLKTTSPQNGSAVTVSTNGSFSVSAWAYLNEATTRSQTVASYDGTNTGAFTLFYNGTGKWAYRLAPTDVAPPARTFVVSTSAAVPRQWTHLVGTWDLSTRTMRLYVNGVEQASAVLDATAVPFTATRFSVGASTGSDVFAGALEDVRAYGSVLTAAEILEFATPRRPLLTASTPSVPAGGTASITIGAGGDTNVVKYLYSIGTPALDRTATPATAGGEVSIPIPTDVPDREIVLYAAAVDTLGRRSLDNSVTSVYVQPSTRVFKGVVYDDTYVPVAGARVELVGTSYTATTDARGAFQIVGAPEGPYTVRASIGGVCGLEATELVRLYDLPNIELYMWHVTDQLGYSCAMSTSTFTAGTSTLGLTGDDAVARTPLPFPFPFYGGAYREAYVDTNGLVSMTDPGKSFPYDGQGDLPTEALPNAVIAPFWDDLVVDSSASVRTRSTGSGSTARFTVEWNNVHRKGSTAQRLSFAATLAPDGTVTTNYTGLDSDAERGASAVVGIEADGGGDGLRVSKNAAALTSGQAITFDYPGGESPVKLWDLSGTLTNASGAAVTGATVTLNPSGITTTTGTGGAWRFDDLVADSYTVSVVQGTRCRNVASAQVDLGADTVQNLQLKPDYGTFGYACSAGTGGFVGGTTKLTLDTESSGAIVPTGVSLPSGFTFPYHGVRETGMRVHPNGFVSFTDVPGYPPGGVYGNNALPQKSWLNPIVAPFWDTMQFGTDGGIYTRFVDGAAGSRQFVVEWRKALITGTSATVTFDAVFHEDGRIVFHYGTVTAGPASGASATIGVENHAGTGARTYSFNEESVTSNMSITWTPAPKGTISGSVTNAVTGTAVAGRAVTLQPAGLSTTTGADGGYSFGSLSPGEYTVAVTPGAAECVGQWAGTRVVYVGGTEDVDLSLTLDGDEGGYTCAAGATTYVQADTKQDVWSHADDGDEGGTSLVAPFPVPLYGDTYTAAWASTNGVISFKEPLTYDGYVDKFPAPIPSVDGEYDPNAAVYVHWQDWMVDASAGIYTRTTGTAAAKDRKWIVEWRNVRRSDDPYSRVSFEVIFDEATGSITTAYADLDAADTLESGAESLVGIENGAGTIANVASYEKKSLVNGRGFTFTPHPAGPGTVAGTVICQGVPVPGATVRLGSLSATTDADGRYTFGTRTVPAGSHAVIATLTGTCAGSRVEQVTVGTNTTVAADFWLGATPAGGGYTLAEGPVTYIEADTVLTPDDNDEGFAQITFPFDVTLYGTKHRTPAWVGTNGLITFNSPTDAYPDALPIPSPRNRWEPNAAVYPFWHDWVVDGPGSMRTATIENGDNDKFVVEWRDVSAYYDENVRASFEVIFEQNGTISFAYRGLDGNFMERAGASTIGIENADGSAALQYLYRHPALRPGVGVVITPPSS